MFRGIAPSAYFLGLIQEVPPPLDLSEEILGVDHNRKCIIRLRGGMKGPIGLLEWGGRADFEITLNRNALVSCFVLSLVHLLTLYLADSHPCSLPTLLSPNLGLTLGHPLPWN